MSEDTRAPTEAHTPKPAAVEPNSEPAPTQSRFVRVRPVSRVDLSASALLSVSRFIWPKCHVKLLAYHLWLKRSTVQDWLSGQRRIPLARLRRLDELAVEMAKRLSGLSLVLRAEIAAREREPPVRRGWYTVKDHGDGHPPHNRQAQTLRRLGLLGPAKPRKGKSET